MLPRSLDYDCGNSAFHQVPFPLLCGNGRVIFLCRGMAESSSSAGSRSEKRYTQLKAWVACHEVFLRVHQATRTWPPHELHGLGSQATRAAFSAGANIAEGVAKGTAREFRRFLDISIGSLGELSYILLAARDIGLLSQ